MKTVSLNVKRKYRVGFRDFSNISVPFSRLPVGCALYDIAFLGRMSEMKKLYDENSDDSALAGAFFWYFAEINAYS